MITIVSALFVVNANSEEQNKGQCVSVQRMKEITERLATVNPDDYSKASIVLDNLYLGLSGSSKSEAEPVYLGGDARGDNNKAPATEEYNNSVKNAATIGKKDKIIKRRQTLASEVAALDSKKVTDVDIYHHSPGPEPDQAYHDYGPIIDAPNNGTYTAIGAFGGAVSGATSVFGAIVGAIGGAIAGYAADWAAD